MFEGVVMAVPPAGGPRVLTRLAEAATVLGLFVATGIGLVAWLHPFDADRGVAGPAAGTESAAAPVTERAEPATAGTRTTAPPTTDAAALPLAAMTPSEGAANLGPLPAALQGRPGYADAVSIPCASGQSGDKHRQVTYPLRKRHAGLRASIEPHREPADDVNFQVTVFGDDRVLRQWTVPAGASDTLSVGLAGVDTLTIRVTCGLPGGTLVLTNPVLHKP